MKRVYIPNQHGAWAMLIIPFLIGMFAAKPVPLHALLFLGWLLAYLFSSSFLPWLRTKNPIYRQPMLVYISLLIPAAVLLTVNDPALVRWIPLFFPLFLVNGYYALRNRERSLMNNLAAVVQFSMMLFVAYDTGGGDNWKLAGELFGFCVLYFMGTVFYVKTMIREKSNRTYYRLSVGYHSAMLAVTALWYPPVLAAPLTVLLARAVWSPRLKLSVKQCGILEIAYSVLISCSVVFVYTFIK